jgi:Domain of unknown function (DUF427)
MGLSWQQGPLSPGAIGCFLVPQPLTKTLLYGEPLRRRMRVRFGGTWIADSENVFLLFEPGRYPVAYFPETDVSPGALERTEYATRHPELATRTPRRRLAERRKFRFKTRTLCKNRKGCGTRNFTAETLQMQKSATDYIVKTNVTLLERRGIARGRSSCARNHRPLFRAGTFRSWGARRLVPQSAVI